MITEATRRESRIAAVIHNFVQNVLSINSFRSVRVGRGVKRLRKMTGVAHHILAHWHEQDHDDFLVLELPNTDVELEDAIEGDITNRLMVLVSISTD